MTDHGLHGSAADSVYDEALLGTDVSHWAFGSAELPADDPLLGMDAAPPEGVEAEALATYCLMLGDDALVASHRLSEWCSRAPDLEEDIALANVALDLLGQARLLLARGAAASAAVVPMLPAGSPVPDEDALAFFRDAEAYRNTRLVEPEHGDFAETVVRLLLLATWRLALMERLRSSRDPVLAAISGKAVKELTYHRDYAARWCVTLAQGTDESRSRMLAALPHVWAFHEELFVAHPVEMKLAAAGVAVDPASVRTSVSEVLAEVWASAGLATPTAAQVGPVAGGRGRDGRHTEALSRMLAEMQSVARAHPGGRW